MYDLQGKAALVTGAGRGIGRAIALRLAEEGADVAAADIVGQTASDVADTMGRLGRKAVAITADVSSAADVDRMVAQTVKSFGRIDLLYNNAGVVVYKPMVETSEEEWDDLFKVNMKGVFLVAKAVANQMIKQGGGKIINIASVAGKRGVAGMSAYCASKFGVVGFTQALAWELANHGITVNAICPGVVDTPMWEKLDAEIGGRQGLPKGEAIRRTINTNIIKRVETPEDVANLAAFLASKESDYITGQSLNVCGGRVFY